MAVTGTVTGTPPSPGPTETCPPSAASTGPPTAMPGTPPPLPGNTTSPPREEVFAKDYCITAPANTISCAVGLR